MALMPNNAVDSNTILVNVNQNLIFLFLFVSFTYLNLTTIL